MSASPVSALERESTALRARRLAAARRRATALLVGVTAVFVAVTAVGSHGTLPGYVQAGADRYLAGHHVELRDLFEAESPRWVPDAVYRMVFDRLYHRLRQRLVAMAADPDDETRRQFEGLALHAIAMALG